MKRILILNSMLIFLSYFSTHSQTIRWNMVSKDSIFPKRLKTEGYLKINEAKTNFTDLYFDFENNMLFYSNKSNKQYISVSQEDYIGYVKASIFLSIPEYENGKEVKLFDSDYRNDFSGKIAKVLRQKVYEKDNYLNTIRITTGVIRKENQEPKIIPPSNKLVFTVNNSKDLDVVNKTTINCKLISITPKALEYITSDGEIYIRNNQLTKSLTLEDGKSNSEKRKEKRKIKNQIRIVNIQFGDLLFLNIQDFYNFIYSDYESRFYASQKQFKNDMKGKKVMEILSNWGPFSEKLNIGDKNIFVWNYDRKITESTSNSISQLTTITNSDFSSEVSATATINSNSYNYSDYSISGYGDVLNYYKNTYGASNSYIDYYSRNSAKQFTTRFQTSNSKTKTKGFTIDDTKKIGLIVNEKLIVEELITKNFFESPKYGDTINFVD